MNPVLRTLLFTLALLLPPFAQADLVATYNSAADVPVTAGSYTAEGAFSAALNFAPEVGTTLTVVKNTGAPFIEGQFSNLAQGQFVVLSHNGINYRFVANYFGGTGNDLVLQWAKVRAVAWGVNTSGQLGDGSSVSSFRAVDVTSTGALNGKTILALSVGGGFSLALCSDGTVAAWGRNTFGQVGFPGPDTEVPVRVDTAGVLAGRTIVAISAGGRHSLALCDDGTVAAWGANAAGQLGNNTTTDSPHPVLVYAGGALSGRTVIAVSAGARHSVALCSDGTLVAWGANSTGLLGDGSGSDSPVPVAVKSDGVLAGKSVVDVAAGHEHNVALCSDGTIVAWGWDFGESYNRVPVAVDSTGALSGRTVIHVAAGTVHCVALCSDGSVAAWGGNELGQLGNDSNVSSQVPVAVSTAGVLAGKRVVQVTAGDFHNLARCSDGSLVTWGVGYEGTLGVEDLRSSRVPVAVDRTALAAGERFTNAWTGTGAAHNLALVALPSLATAADTRSSDVTETSIKLHGTVDLDGVQGSAFFEYGLTSSYGATLPVALASSDGFGAQAVVAELTGLKPGTLYHFRLTVVTADYTVSTKDAEFATAADIVAHLTSVNDVMLTRSAITARGSRIDISLGFTPPTGANFLVLENTGTEFINGQFTNLEQGQLVVLSHGGMNYRFLADYHGGTGNDLVLRWANTRAVGWGGSDSSEPGPIDSAANRKMRAFPATGALEGKTIVSFAKGDVHSLALCSDGSIAAWGSNNYGQLGDNTQLSSGVPVAVNMEGQLSGKRVIAIAAGARSSYALCSDGTLAAWGDNQNGLLGTGNTEDSSVPVAVVTDGALSGKTVVAVAGGRSNVLALCSDGSLVTWGVGGLGNRLHSHSNVPVPVNSFGALADKTVIAISAGGAHSLVLCSDGSVAGWGSIGLAQQGTQSLSSDEPMLITTGVLAGKTAVAVSAGYFHSIVLCSDGTLATWGDNTWGELGDGTNQRKVAPVAINGFGVLQGKSVLAVAAGAAFSLVYCADGSLAAWGNNLWGQLGDGTVESRSLPIAVDQSTLAHDERTTAFFAGGSPSQGGYSFALIGFSPRLQVKDAALTSVGRTTATLSGVVKPNGSPATAYFEYGLDTAYGQRAPVMLSPADGMSEQAVSAVLNNLAPGKVYHYGLTATNSEGTVTVPGGTFYTRSDLSVIFGSASDVPLTVPAFTAGLDVAFTAMLSFAPSPGTILTVVKNTGLEFIQGEFGNLSQGETIVLTFQGVNHRFVANYYGGDGNDLVLQWAPSQLVAWNLLVDGKWQRVPDEVPSTGALAGKTITSVAVGDEHNLALCADGTLAAWGSNSEGQLGNGTTTASLEPVLVDRSGVLAGRRVIAVAVSRARSLALCSDGVVAAWGSGSGEQWGEPGLVPVAVTLPGELARKKIVSIAATAYFSLALCSDGEVIRWEWSGLMPEKVEPAGALAGRSVVSIAAGEFHAVALCFDGAIVAWGDNDSGQLGDGTNIRSAEPVLVKSEGILAGKTVTAISAGGAFSLAVCADGTIATWGANFSGQLGNGTNTPSSLPVAVDRSGALNGKSLAAVKTGSHHVIALCTDGTVAAWGSNAFDPGTVRSSVPLLVSTELLQPGARFSSAFAGAEVSSNFAVVGTRPLPSAKSLTVSAIGKREVTFDGDVDPNGNTTAVQFEFGLDTTYGSSVSATLEIPDGIGWQAVRTHANGLVPGTRYYYRLTVDNAFGSVSTAEGTFTTLLEVEATYRSAKDIPFTANGISAAGGTFSATLNFAPPPGTNLMVLDNTGMEPIEGRLDNLTHGQVVSLSHEDVEFRFVANYYGGTGNDLVLQWAGTRLLAWGSNGGGQLGNGSVVLSRMPVAVHANEQASARTFIAGAAGASHTLALCSDGVVLSWGANIYGQLGIPDLASSATPVKVDSAGVLAGKVVIAVAAGREHSLALCADGTVAAWGRNLNGQLGDGTYLDRRAPVAVDGSGVLQGRKVVAISAGDLHSLALCSDGTIAAWGAGSDGQLGRSILANSAVPVAPSSLGALQGRTVTAISAGSFHNLAVCADGTVVAWGASSNGRLGTQNHFANWIPAQVHAATGGLLDKRVVAASAGKWHSLALCSDGTIVAWGSNRYQQMGVQRGIISLPVVVELTGVLAGKVVTGISSGGDHNMVTCSDGSVVAWGRNDTGQAGTGAESGASLPALVAAGALYTGERYSTVFSGPSASHSLAIVSSPNAPAAITLPVTEVSDGGVTFLGSVNAAGGEASVTFEYGTDTDYGSIVQGEPAVVDGSTSASVSATVANLPPNTTFHYRVRATNAGGTMHGNDLTFTTPPDTNGPKGGTMTVGTGPLADAGAALPVRFEGWGDPSPPLAYTVLIGVEVIAAEGPSSLREITAPVNAGEYTITGRVRDALGNFTEVIRSIKVIATIEDWRTHYFGSPENSGDGGDDADPDGDGISNRFEFIAGLEPRDRESRFNVRIEWDAEGSGEKHIVFGPVIAGRTYTVKSKLDPADATWEPLLESSSTEYGSERTIIDHSPAGGKRVYRVEITRP